MTPVVERSRRGRPPRAALVGAHRAGPPPACCPATRPTGGWRRAATIGDLRELARRHGAARGLRLHRRRGGRGDQPPPLPGGVRPGRVPPAACCATSPSSTLDDAARPAVVPAAGARPDRLHPADAHRGRAGRRPGRRAGRHPVRAVHDGHDVAGGVAAAAPGARRWFQLYLWRDREASAALVERARGGRLRGAGADRRHPGGRSAAARRPQRVHHPAGAVPADRWPTPPCTRAGGSTCSPPSRWSSPRCTRWGGTVAELVDRVFEPAATLADVARAAAGLAGRAGRQGRADAGRRPGGGRRRRRRRRRLQPRRPPARPGADAAGAAARRGGRGRRPGRGATWTAASSTAPTSSPRWPLGATRVPGRPGLPVRADGRRRARGAAGGRHPARRGAPAPCSCSASPRSPS